LSGHSFFTRFILCKYLCVFPILFFFLVVSVVVAPYRIARTFVPPLARIAAVRVDFACLSSSLISLVFPPLCFAVLPLSESIWVRVSPSCRSTRILLPRLPLVSPGFTPIFCFFFSFPPPVMRSCSLMMWFLFLSPLFRVRLFICENYHFLSTVYRTSDRFFFLVLFLFLGFQLFPRIFSSLDAYYAH